MICLGLDCAGKVAGVAVTQDGRLLYECFLDRGLTHSETLLPMVEAAFAACGISAAQLDLIGVGAGPGSFTGLRIGMALAKGLPVNQPRNFRDDADVAALAALRPDVLVVAAYGLLLPQRVLDIPTMGPYNARGYGGKSFRYAGRTRRKAHGRCARHDCRGQGGLCASERGTGHPRGQDYGR